MPSGSGSHSYAWIEKRGLTTRDVVLALQQRGLKEVEIGVAGLKDKHALTRQWLSVPQRHAHLWEEISGPSGLEGLRILEVSRHRNKLGIGHLRGNRFAVQVRGGDQRAAQAVMDILRVQGVPNYFGPQRFGRFGTNAVDGLRVIRGEEVPGGYRLKRFFIAALQSLLFNHMLSARVAQGLFDRVVAGDWAKKHATGGMFKVDDVAAEVARAANAEISAVFPLYGKKVKISEAEAGVLEQASLAHFGLRWLDFTKLKGSRRISRIFLEDVSLTPSEAGFWLSFALPKGSFATSVLREVMKVEVDAPLAIEKSDEGAVLDE